MSERFISRLIAIGTFLFFANSLCFARDVSVRWTPNTDSDLAGYYIYYRSGLVTGDFDDVVFFDGSPYVDVHNVTTATITGLDPALNYILAATAYNETGAESVLSDVVVFYDIVPPTVAIISPANNGTVIGGITVSADASDAGGIAKVELYIDNVLQSTKTTAPYNFNWDTSTLPEKTYTLFAQAYDLGGNEAQSSSIQVKVVHGTYLNDALLTLKFVLGLENPTAAQFVQADVAPINMSTLLPQPDGKLDIDDVIVMLRRAAGLLTW